MSVADPVGHEFERATQLEFAGPPVGALEAQLEEVAGFAGEAALGGAFDVSLDSDDQSSNSSAGGTTGRKRSRKRQHDTTPDDAGKGMDIVREYLTEIGRYPLLTKDDEYAHAQAIRKGKEARAALDNSEVALSAKERREHRREVRRGEESERVFVQSNLRLVVSIAKKYQGNGLDLMDLIQEGNLGLMHAVELFDEEKGFKFSTYATWWIRQSITRGIANTSRTIRVPAHAHESITVIGGAVKRFFRDNNRNPTVAELAELTPLSEEKIAELLEHTHVSHSLNEQVGEDGTMELGDLFADKATSGFDESTVDRLDRAKLVEGLLAELNDREKEIFRLRFGLDGDRPLTLDEIGKRYNITRERVRQIEAKALKNKLRPSAALRGFNRGDLFDS